MEEELTQTHEQQKYLSFKVGEELYGTPVQVVREIIRHSKITSVPDSPEVVKGVINIRGKIVPVISLRKKFSLEDSDFNQDTCFIIIDVEDVQVGIIVDQVCDVKEFSDDQVELAGKMNTVHATDYLIGIGKTESQPVIMIDLAKALSLEYFDQIIQNTPLEARSA